MEIVNSFSFNNNNELEISDNYNNKSLSPIINNLNESISLLNITTQTPQKDYLLINDISRKSIPLIQYSPKIDIENELIQKIENIENKLHSVILLFNDYNKINNTISDYMNIECIIIIFKIINHHYLH